MNSRDYARMLRRKKKSKSRREENAQLKDRSKFYDRALLLSLENGISILKKVANGQKLFNINGVRFTWAKNKSKVRMLTFLKHGIKCASCGKVAEYFALEKAKGKYPDGSEHKVHINLWGTSDSGTPLLFTMDHVIPKSKGGSTSLKNTQTMCCVCNERKSDSMTMVQSA